MRQYPRYGRLHERLSLSTCFRTSLRFTSITTLNVWVGFLLHRITYFSCHFFYKTLKRCCQLKVSAKSMADVMQRIRTNSIPKQIKAFSTKISQGKSLLCQLSLSTWPSVIPTITQAPACCAYHIDFQYLVSWLIEKKVIGKMHCCRCNACLPIKCI